MTFDKRQGEDWALSRPPLGAPGAEVDEDGVALNPGAPPTKDLHLRINPWESYWLKRMVAEDITTMQRIGRRAIRQAILEHQRAAAPLPRTGT